jgi:hypothetical protein
MEFGCGAVTYILPASQMQVRSVARSRNGTHTFGTITITQSRTSHSAVAWPRWNLVMVLIISHQQMQMYSSCGGPQPVETARTHLA